MPDKTWADLGVPTAADFNTYFRDQVITSCTSGTRPASPVNGRVIFETDTRKYMAYSTTDVAWSELVTTGAWTSWTPVVVQGVTPTLTNTSTKYHKAGRLVTATSTVTLTSAGTAASVITCTLPFNCSSANNNAVGSFIFSGAATHAGVVVLSSATTVGFIVGGSSTGFLGITPAVTIANTNSLNFTITYEATT